MVICFGLEQFPGDDGLMHNKKGPTTRWEGGHLRRDVVEAGVKLGSNLVVGGSSLGVVGEEVG